MSTISNQEIKRGKMQKKAAFEMSMTTVVIIVLAMTMLILGLTLVRKIFKFGTSSIDIIDEGVKNQINNLFAEGGELVVVSLPGLKAKIKPGTDSFGFVIGAKTPGGSLVGSRDRLKYRLSLQSGDCVERNDKTTIENIFVYGLDKWQSFDEFGGDQARARVELRIPKGTALCIQKVGIDVKDTEIGATIGGSYFTLEIARGTLGF